MVFQKIKNELLNRRFFKNLFFWAPPFVWGIIIFSFSSSQVPPISSTDWQNFVINKTAHIVEYSIFSFLVYRAFFGSGINKKYSFWYSLLICILYAFSDEYHQSFIPGREPALRDISIDSVASFFVLFWLTKIVPNTSGRIREIFKELYIIK